MSCECCQSTPAVSLSWSYESYSATATLYWCGYSSFLTETPAKRYLTKVDTVASKSDINQNRNGAISPGVNLRRYQQSTTDYSSVQTSVYSSDRTVPCSESSSSVCGGTWYKSVSGETITGGDNPGAWESVNETLYNPNCTTTVLPETCSASGSFSTCGGGGPVGCLSATTSIPRPPDTATKKYQLWTSYYGASTDPACSGSYESYEYKWVTDLSDGHEKPTISEALDEAEGRYPSEPNGSATSATYSRSETSNYVTANLRKVKATFSHPPSATCYLMVWFRKRFRPQGTTGSADVVTDLGTYVWEGSGDPCISDPDKAVDDAANKVVGDSLEIDPPSSPGAATIEINKFSYLSDDTPDDSLSDGTRPIPDTNPNGFPL